MKVIGVTHQQDHRRLLLSRRDILAGFGIAGAAWLMEHSLVLRRAAAEGAEPSCLLHPQQTEGPYFIDERLNRSDIRSDPSTGQVTPGIPLTLTIRAMTVHPADCRPLVGAFVDIWHCDAMGFYSDVRDPWFNTVGRKFLRGYQMTDAGGKARFITIYPGWYPGRTVHIHVKIRTALIGRRRFEFTSQLYFDDELTDHVLSHQPYASRGARATRNQQDWIFRHGGDRLLLNPTQTKDGYAATFTFGLRLA
ncbi:MAG: intradiol ring-cleavage dioxygenase [Nitrospira sp.]|nr:intradiol ring-cleavage dioxygenase [Nitrospira sp.]MCP9440958.1 intradiol ring-cleavage dioxygenase [Nitrospira sp.]